MSQNKILKTIVLGSLLTSSLYAFDLGALAKDVLKEVSTPTTSTTKSATTSSLSNSTLSSGLKEALNKGVKIAVENLGKENGYLNNALVKIPLPENLEKAKVLVTKVGGQQYIDDLVVSMNKAATQAAPKTAEIFANAISKMSIDDANKILQGNDDAATSYFQTNTSEDLKKLITPIIKESMSNNQVATYYKSFNSFYQSNVKGYVENTSAMSYAKQFGVDSYLPGSNEEELDDYVTTKAINGLFVMIAKEEKAIRENPVSRTTDLLKQVFGK